MKFRRKQTETIEAEQFLSLDMPPSGVYVMDGHAWIHTRFNGSVLIKIGDWVARDGPHHYSLIKERVMLENFEEVK